MVKKSEAIAHLKSEVNKPHDFDGLYGSQCADWPNYYLYKFWKIRLYGNAIDFLESAKKQGLTVI